jgi:cysteine desulfurase
VFFTSGGTESNNAWLKCFNGDCILTTVLEHDSVLDPLFNTDAAKFYIQVCKDGSLDLGDLEYALRWRTGSRSVAVMWVNNELGTVNPMKEIGTLCKKYNAAFYADAVQAAGHIPMNVKDCGINFCSLAGHKFGAPLGVGALYISNDVRKCPWIRGGGQENGMRGGTENVPGIVGIGKAAEIVTERLPQWRAKWACLRESFLTEMTIGMPREFYINGTKDPSSNIISLTIPGVNSESLLLLLDQFGIYLSAGSACSAASGKASFYGV